MPHGILQVSFVCRKLMMGCSLHYMEGCNQVSWVLTNRSRQEQSHHLCNLCNDPCLGTEPNCTSLQVMLCSTGVPVYHVSRHYWIFLLAYCAGFTEHKRSCCLLCFLRACECAHGHLCVVEERERSFVRRWLFAAVTQVHMKHQGSQAGSDCMDLGHLTTSCIEFHI